MQKNFLSREILLKQLHYRSNHRGCKETDILLGKFFNEKIAEFDDATLELYREFIEEDDMLIYDWILKKCDVPQIYQGLVEKIQRFHQI